MKINFAKTGLLSLLALGVLGTTMSSPSWAAGRFAQHHPWRAHVLGRDNAMNRQLQNDKGHLGGHYRHLERRDLAIRRQEQRDARQNGGHLTSQEYRHFNREENNLQHQINQDNSH